MSPRRTVEQWVMAFNKADIQTLKSLYAPEAVNHQMPNTPITGRTAIGKMFKDEFAVAERHCIVVQIIEEGEWAVLEWRDLKDFRGCGFFHVIDGLIHTQRGYWDKLSFKQLYNIEGLKS
ncbi:MAG: nuclear transport factor 2 family protein [Ginsengibacter sp.]